MPPNITPSHNLTRRLADLFASLSQVEAVALGGSRAGGSADASSDIDLVVYTRADVPLAVRQTIVEKSGGASQANLGLTFWGPGDEWFDAQSGIEVDIVYFDASWMESQITRVLAEHQPSLGYSTCYWHTVRNSQILHDPNHWLQALQARCQQPYPEALQRAIITFNHPVLRGVIPAYSHQLEKALQRQDLVSLNHRLAALLASYFDILFALNRLPHPGEKRLAAYALAHCKLLPIDMTADISALLLAGAQADPDLIGHLTRLLDRLDRALEAADCVVSP